MALARADLLDRMARSLQAWQRALGQSATGGAVLEAGDVVASLVPAAPTRSILNAAAPPAGHRVSDDELQQLAERYAAANIAAWGVWIHEDDAERQRLEAHGLTLDSRPTAMALDLADLRPPHAEARVTAERTTDLPTLAEPLSAAYGFPLPFLPSATPDLLAHCTAWIARIEDTPAAGAILVHAGQDAGVYFVGTAPEHRGRGAAGTALHAALTDAKQHGCTTSTLQASAMGRSLYADLGYQELGTHQLWEHRRA